jgi:hypothetical protein
MSLLTGKANGLKIGKPNNLKVFASKESQRLKYWKAKQSKGLCNKGK